MLDKLYFYQANVIKVKDADTLALEVDCGFDIWLKKDARLNRINAFETKLGKNTDATKKAAGLQGKEYVAKLIEGKSVIVKTALEKEKYGRLLVDVYYTKDGQWFNLNDELVVLNFAIYQSY